LAGGFFSEKELIVLTRLFSDMRAASAKLSPDDRDRVPTKAAFQALCQTNSLDGWIEQAAVVRKAALAFQCDPKVEPVFRLTLTDFLHPVLAKINQDNDIPVFELAPDDLLPPRNEAREHLQALEALKADLAKFQTENAVLLAENKQLREHIETLKAALMKAEKETRSFISVFSNNKYWSDNKDSPFSVSVGDGLVEALVGILHVKEIREALGNGVRRTVSTGKAFFGRLGRWAEAHAIKSIERGAAEKVEAFGHLGAQLAIPALEGRNASAVEVDRPADFDIIEVHAMILRGEPPPATWRTFVKELRFERQRNLRDLSAVSVLSALKWLSLDNTQVRDLSALAGLSVLSRLYLANTLVDDLSAVASLSVLTQLFLANTQVGDLHSLSGLSALRKLSLARTQVSDLSALSGLSALEWLSLNGTKVSDLSALSGLSALKRLFLDNTQVSDLASMAGLSKLHELSLSDTQVSDLHSLSGLSALRRLSLARTQVSDLSALSGLSALEWLSLNDTKVSDLSALSSLSALKRLYLGDNKDLDVSVLDHLEHLTIVGGPAPRRGKPRLD
jgi:hypothetical protein